MDLSYNYGYLREFMESHKLVKKDLLEALGCGDYVSLNKWLDGKVPVHVTAMLRMCNFYNIPLDGFFYDGDGLPVEVRPPLPDRHSQILPTDGYGIKEGRGRGIVETRIKDRTVTSPHQAQAVAEGLKRQEEQQRLQDIAIRELGSEQDDRQRDIETEEPTGEPASTSASMPITEQILRLKLDHANEMRQMEREHHDREDRIRRDCQAGFDAERNRLMDIIERQNTELSKLYAQTRHGEGARYDIVAEDDGRKD
jgi:transcriptional regulator with XRE-family HTH domain